MKLKRSFNKLLGHDGILIIKKIMKTKTIGQLNYLRREIVSEMQSSDEEVFFAIQLAFIKQKKVLNRIPILERGTDWETEVPTK